VKLPGFVVRAANAVTTFALIAGIPRPPYTRNNALVAETIGRRTGERGRWREARLRMLEDDPEAYLARMNRVHAGFVRREASTPSVVELVPDPMQKVDA